MTNFDDFSARILWKHPQKITKKLQAFSSTSVGYYPKYIPQNEKKITRTFSMSRKIQGVLFTIYKHYIVAMTLMMWYLYIEVNTGAKDVKHGLLFNWSNSYVYSMAFCWTEQIILVLVRTKFFNISYQFFGLLTNSKMYKKKF